MMINRQVPSRGRPRFYDPHNGILQTPNGPVPVGKLSSRQASTLAATQEKMVHSAKIKANPGNLSKPDVNQSTTMKMSQPQNHFNKTLSPQANFQQTRGKLTPKIPPYSSTIHTPAMQTPPLSSTIHTPAAQTPPHSATIHTPATQTPPLSSTIHTPATQTPPRSTTIHTPAAKTPPLSSTIHTPATQTPPHSSTIHTPATQTPPLSSTIHTPAAQTPPHSATIHTPATQSPPQSSTIHTPAAQTPPRSTTIHTPATQTPPRSTTIHTPATQTPPQSSTIHTPAAQTPPQSSTIHTPATQTPPKSSTIHTPAAQTPPQSSTIHTPATQTPPKSSTIHTPAAQTPPQSSIIHTPATQTPPQSLTIHTPAAQTPPQSSTIHTPATQTPPHASTMYTPAAQIPSISSTIHTAVTQTPPHSATIYKPAASSSSNSVNTNTPAKQTPIRSVSYHIPAQTPSQYDLNYGGRNNPQVLSNMVPLPTNQLTEQPLHPISFVWPKRQFSFPADLSKSFVSSSSAISSVSRITSPGSIDVAAAAKKNFSPNYQPRDIQAVIGRDGFLGRGGFGRVRLAFVEALGAVAIKCVAPTGSAEDIENMEKMFAEEISLLHQASHVNVVRIEGYTKWSGAVGALMEYVPGGNLKTLVMSSGNRNLAIPPVIRLRFCADIASGITFLHHGFSGNKRMTHGDLKPENILLTADLRCKISDFGGANLGTCTNTSNLDTLKSTGNQFTPVYAAPERLRGINIRSSKAMDVYSVGMIHHSILTRDAPFAEIREMSMFESLICAGNRPNSDAIEKFKESVHENEEDVEIIVLLQEEMVKCWHHDPYKRPSMMDVRDRLLKRLATEDVAIISQHVADIVKQTKMSLKYLSPKQFRCKSIDQFVSPGFDGEELESTNT